MSAAAARRWGPRCAVLVLLGCAAAGAIPAAVVPVTIHTAFGPSSRPAVRRQLVRDRPRAARVPVVPARRFRRIATPVSPPPLRPLSAARPSSRPAGISSSGTGPRYPFPLKAVTASSHQAVTVTVSSDGSTTGSYEAWQRTSAGWRLVFGPWTANIGYGGLAPLGAKREGDGKTPAGVYGFSGMFGVDPDPGVSYSWRAVTGSYDVWDDDPSSPRYNEWVDSRTANPGLAPEPMDNTPAYDYGAVIAYNQARTPGLGSAIFMHVSTGGSTAGCVSLPVGQLLSVLHWLDPADEPVISIGLG